MHTWENPKPVVEKFVKEKELKQTVLMGGADEAAAFGVRFYPTTFLVDKSGNVRYHKIGVGLEELENELKRLLEE